MGSRKPPEGMLLTTFLEKNYDWAQEPHLYIVLQIPQLLTNPAYRCGAAGTALYKDADQPFRASEGSQKGLQGRLTQYNNYFLPNSGKLFACLRIQKQLVALPNQRVAGDDDALYNVDRGNQTAVLAAERILHHFLDEKNLRWRKETRKELFVPTSGVMQLVEAMRKVQGLQMLLFDEDDWREDTAYVGGIEAPISLKTTETVRRTSAVASKSADQSLVVKLSSTGIQQLRDGNPRAYDRLMTLMREAYNAHGKAQGLTVAAPIVRPQPTPAQPNLPNIVPPIPPPPVPAPPPPPPPPSPMPTVITLPIAAINALQNVDADEGQTAAAIAQLIPQLPVYTPPQTRARTRALNQPRRSGRLANR